MVAVVIGMAVVFAVGVVLGVIAMVSAVPSRKDRPGTLTQQPPEVLAGEPAGVADGAPDGRF
jgi:hypothetical protein